MCSGGVGSHAHIVSLRSCNSMLIFSSLGFKGNFANCGAVLKLVTWCLLYILMLWCCVPSSCCFANVQGMWRTRRPYG